MTALLEVSNVGVRYAPKEPLRLADFSCRLEGAETLVLVGESGAGKSTVLGMVSGLLAPTEGSVHVLGENPYAGAHRRVQRHLGQIRQQPRASLDPSQSALDAVAEVLQHLRGVAAAAAREKASEMLTACGVAKSLHLRRPSALSGGECQRVALARALVHKPALLVADEPTAALDPIVAQETLGVLLERVAEYGAGLLYVTHNLNEPERIGGQLGVLLGGKMVEWVTTFTSWESMTHPYTRYLARSRNEPVANLVLAGSGCPFRNLCPRADEKCSTAPPEELFAEGHAARCWHW